MKRADVPVELSPLSVKTFEAARLLGCSVRTLKKYPFEVLPFFREGRDRFYHYGKLIELRDRKIEEARRTGGAYVGLIPSPSQRRRGRDHARTETEAVA